MKNLKTSILLIQSLIIINCNTSTTPIPINSIYQKGDIVYSIDKQGSKLVDEHEGGKVHIYMPVDIEIIYRKPLNKIMLVDVATGTTNNYSIKEINDNKYITMNGDIFCFTDTSISFIQGGLEISDNHIFKTISY